MFRTEAFLRAGGFDESLKASEDFDLIYRVARTSSVGLLGRVGFRRRRHGGNMSRRTFHVLDYKLRSRQKLRDMETDPELLRLLDRFIAECHFAYAEALAVEAGERGLSRWVSGFRLDPRINLPRVKTLIKSLLPPRRAGR
jgi:hypothetical protein